MSKQRFGPEGMIYEDSYHKALMNADGSVEASLKSQLQK